jgi:hypothetical protein
VSRSLFPDLYLIKINLPFDAQELNGFSITAVHLKTSYSRSILETLDGMYAAFMFKRLKDNFIIIVHPKEVYGGPRGYKLFWDVALTQRHGLLTLEEIIQVSNRSIRRHVSTSLL